jgi:hypothetical protein
MERGVAERGKSLRMIQWGESRVARSFRDSWKTITLDLVEMVSRLFSHHVWVVCIMARSWATEEATKQKSSTYKRMTMIVRTYGGVKVVSGKSRRMVVTRSAM